LVRSTSKPVLTFSPWQEEEGYRAYLLESGRCGGRQNRHEQGQVLHTARCLCRCLRLVARGNCAIKIGDLAHVSAANDIKYGKRQVPHWSPADNQYSCASICRLRRRYAAHCILLILGLSGNLFDVYLRPYFLEAYRPVRKGSSRRR
jgi:hypothetical protein